jgi:threonine synthase
MPRAILLAAALFATPAVANEALTIPPALVDPHPAPSVWNGLYIGTGVAFGAVKGQKGAFGGDVFAGYVASRMGLPVAKLIVATNINDILHRALSAGDYSVGTVSPTAAPSMDIQVSSNFERLLFDLHGRDGQALATAMQGFEASRRFNLSPAMVAEAASLFSSARIDADAMQLAMRWAHDGAGEIIDPHTAIGLAAARIADLPRDVPVVTLATAHPAKFGDAVERATGIRPSLPARIGGLFDRAERYVTLPAEIGAIEAFVAEQAGADA